MNQLINWLIMLGCVAAFGFCIYLIKKTPRDYWKRYPRKAKTVTLDCGTEGVVRIVVDKGETMELPLCKLGRVSVKPSPHNEKITVVEAMWGDWSKVET